MKPRQYYLDKVDPARHMFTKAFTILGHQSEGHKRLFSLLSDLFKVRFEGVIGGARDGVAGVIVLDGERPSINWSSVEAGHVYIAGRRARTERLNDQATVRFTDSCQLPACLRGLTLEAAEAGDAYPLDESTGEVLASVGDLPVWTLSRSNGYICHRVSLPLPELTADQCVSDFLNGDRFLRLLPLFHFLRCAVGPSAWSPPPLRACVVIDDPNLHWTSYGRIKYRRLVTWAKETQFHVSVATIPLDALWFSGAAARLFRENEKWLSLVVHGNDHSVQELARPLPESARVAVIARALQRVEALERKAGVRVARVMVPPHGDCTEAYMRVMVRLGFEGMTTTRRVLWGFNPLAYKPAWASLDLADSLADHFPVLMRFQFNSADAPARIAISAFLGQPLIPYGHHNDFEGDASSFLHTIAAINRLPGVKWMNPAEILRSNFYHRLKGDTLHIKMFSRKVCVELPEGARQLKVELAISANGSADRIAFSLKQPQGWIRGQGSLRDPMPCKDGREAVLELTASDGLDPNLVRTGRTPLKAVLRRAATELRDRLLA